MGGHAQEYIKGTVGRENHSWERELSRFRSKFQRAVHQFYILASQKGSGRAHILLSSKTFSNM
jgi:hypothetical protein